MFNSMNMQISIFHINREGIITFLNNLPYLSDSRHPKGMNMHIAIESLKIEHGLETTLMLRYYKYFK